jgi:hypothetical protein
MRKGWTICVAVAALSTLSGCIMPPIVTLASYSVDIVTYAATGKTATDHIYSAVARSDCSFVRVLKGKPICVDPPPADKAIADQTQTPPTGIASVSAPRSHVKVRIGSFLVQANADRSVARYADWHPAITDVTVDGKLFHRVTASALSDDEAAALKAKIASDQHVKLRVAQN